MVVDPVCSRASYAEEMPSASPPIYPPKSRTSVTMSDHTLFEHEAEMTGVEAATLLRELADGLTEGTSIELRGDDRSGRIAAPSDLTIEIELERESDEDEDEDGFELELELSWAAAADGWTATSAADDPDGQSSDRTENADPEQREASSVEAGITAQGEAASMARFEVFRDRADEWRWRLVHRNGNVIATSGEGYTTRRNAENGIESVMTNAPGAEINDGV